MGEPKPEIIEMYLEAEQNFVAQFDPSSETFHRGDPTLVPVGGERIPESMPTVYDNSGAIRDTPMDPNYYYLIEARSMLLELKKILCQICPSIEAIIRAQSFRNPEKRNKTVNDKQRVLLEVLEQVKLLAIKLIAYGELIPNYDEMLNEIYHRSVIEYSDKLMYTDFLQFMNSCTQKIFRDSQYLMQKMKSLS